MTRAEYLREWRRKNPEKQRIYAERYLAKPEKKAKCLETQRAYMRRHRKENPDAWKGYHLKSKYGITPEEKEAMIIAQDRKCAICKCELDDPHVDHIKKPFKLRGILCHNCNVSLGLMKDKPELLRAAADYVEKYA